MRVRIRKLVSTAENLLVFIDIKKLSHLKIFIVKYKYYICICILLLLLVLSFILHLFYYRDHKKELLKAKEDSMLYYDEMYRTTISYASISSVELGRAIERILENRPVVNDLCLFIPQYVCESCMIKELDSLSNYDGSTKIYVFAPDFKKRTVLAALSEGGKSNIIIPYNPDSLQYSFLENTEYLVYFIYCEGKVDDVFIVSKLLQHESTAYRQNHYK